MARRFSLYDSPLRAPHADGKTGLLLLNLGTPDAPTPRGLRRYLAQFLWDPRVIELPRWTWWLVLNGIVLRRRPARSAAQYARIWTAEGSPLMTGTRAIAAGLQREFGDALHVEVGMSYGEPSVASAVRAALAAGCSRLIVLPLYPQYAASSTGSALDALFAALQRLRVVPEVRTIASYPTDPGYIAALAATVREAREQHGEPDRLIVSFHSVPQRYIANGDTYRAECERTAAALIAAAGVPDGKWQLVWQSKFGREEWLTPFLDETLERLPHEGVKRVHVICPGFAADCLETLYEVAIEGAETFVEAGGESLHYIPALNARPDHVAALAAIVRRAGGFGG